MPQQLFLVELNELNFESVHYYCEHGLLPNFKKVFDVHGWQTTTSEQRYEHLEPWIQWVTAHTGLAYSEHGVFRLGDIVSHDLPQIWEQLEERGFTVAAMSPMNAKHRLRRPAFFVPDPWTSTKVTAPKVLARLYRAIAQAVSDNAQSRITVGSAFALLVGWCRYALGRNYTRYLRLLLTSIGSPWRKAIFLDYLLADAFIREVKRTRPHFASLFLNAGAHIQHHYMFSSKCYQGPHRNPTWYVAPNADPVLEVYEAYDRIIGTIRALFPDARLLMATALHQVAHPQVTYYWRLRDHAGFLRKVGVPFERVEPRMSRDFLVQCHDEAEAARAAQILAGAVARDGEPLFELDNRGRDVFVSLVYAHEISPGFSFSMGGKEYQNFHEEVAFVALKNGEHSGLGYFVDCGDAESAGGQFPLSELPTKIMDALGLDAESKGVPDLGGGSLCRMSQTVS